MVLARVVRRTCDRRVPLRGAIRSAATVIEVVLCTVVHVRVAIRLHAAFLSNLRMDCAILTTKSRSGSWVGRRTVPPLKPPPRHGPRGEEEASIVRSICENSAPIRRRKTLDCFSCRYAQPHEVCAINSARQVHPNAQVPRPNFLARVVDAAAQQQQHLAGCTPTAQPRSGRPNRLHLPGR